MPEQIANRMYAPEGTYTLYSERHSGLQYFSSSRATKLTFADLLMKEDGYHVVFNVQDYLYICNYSSTGKVRLIFMAYASFYSHCRMSICHLQQPIHTSHTLVKPDHLTPAASEAIHLVCWRGHWWCYNANMPRLLPGIRWLRCFGGVWYWRWYSPLPPESLQHYLK